MAPDMNTTDTKEEHTMSDKSTHFSKTETTNRIRQIQVEARLVDPSIGQNFVTEVGLRTIEQNVTTPKQAKRQPKGSDLEDFVHSSHAAAAKDECRQHGYVVHLYFTSPGPSGELHSVVVGWTGTPDEPARLIRNDNGWVFDADEPKPKKRSTKKADADEPSTESLAELLPA